jgi:hypothetical protein
MVLITSLSTTLGNSPYPSIRSLFNFIVNPATCDCTLLDWEIPAKTTIATRLMLTPTQQIYMATIKESSKTAFPAIRSCTGVTACNMNSTIVLKEKGQTGLPTWMTFNNDVSLRTLALTPVNSS